MENELDRNRFQRENKIIPRKPWQKSLKDFKVNILIPRTKSVAAETEANGVLRFGVSPDIFLRNADSAPRKTILL